MGRAMGQRAGQERGLMNTAGETKKRSVIKATPTCSVLCGVRRARMSAGNDRGAEF